MKLSPEQTAKVEALKAECALNDVRFTVRVYRSSFGNHVRLLPAKCSQFVPQESGIPEFKSNHLRILRRNAAGLGFRATCMRMPIQQVPDNTYHSSLQEEYYF
jgi:hypothetical protein